MPATNGKLKSVCVVILVEIMLRHHQDANEEPAQVTWRTIFYHEVESLFVREWRRFYGVNALSF
jgi:hypothetical protein